MRRVLLLLVGLLALASIVVASSGGATQAQTRWVISDLGRLGKSSAATAINDRGQVIGWWDPGTGTDRAVIWQNGKARDLGSLGGSYVEANDINDRGQVVGASETKRGDLHAFLWQKGKLRDLGTLGGSESKAVALNDLGEVVGTSETKGGAEHAFLWEKGKMRDLTPRLNGEDLDEVIGINERGMVLLTTQTRDLSPRTHAYVWAGGSLRSLGSLRRGGDADAVDLNDRGQVVGESFAASGSQGRGFLWQGGKMRDLGAFRPSAINDGGQILGKRVARQEQVVLWRSGKATDLGLSVSSGYLHVIDLNNERTVVVGIDSCPCDHIGNPSISKPYVWEGGRWTRLPTLPRTNTAHPWALNNRGQVIGDMARSTDPEVIPATHAVLWTKR